MTNVVGRRLALWLLPAVLVGMLSLAACGSSGGPQGGTTPTPPTAQQILQRAGAVTINDAAINLSGSVTSSGQTTNITGTAEFTKSPARFELQATVPVSGAQISATILVDTAGSTIYFKFGPNSLGIPPNVWYKTSLTGTTGATFGQLASEFSSCISFSSLTNATLVGSDTVNGVAVWHIHGTESATGACASSSSSSSTSATVDVDYNQANYYPVKAVVTASGSTVTITFTSVNSGLTIALPSSATPFP